VASLRPTRSLTMVIEGALAAAWTYGKATYSYNQKRFEFDTTQAQNSAHMMQNLRMDQWNLFREDVRDLFTLTSNHMGAYMLVTTIFLGFVVRLLLVGIPQMPREPPILVLCFGNCFMSGLSFGILSIWLSAHGAIASQSASVQMLTQAVRPPIPTAEEVAGVGFDLSEYEGLGPTKFFQLPAFFTQAEPKLNAVLIEGVAQASERGGVPLLSDVGGTSSFRNTLSDQRATDHRAAVTQERVSQMLTESGGPGPSAAFKSHVRLFMQLQSAYASYDAYARVSLDVCCVNFLMALCYFCVGYAANCIDVASNGVVPGWAGPFCFALNCLVAVAALVMGIFGLELFTSNTRVHLIPWVLFLCIGVALVNVLIFVVTKTDIIHLDISVAALHMLWYIGFTLLARPKDQRNSLPTSFRAVRLLDVFGHFAAAASSQYDTPSRSPLVTAVLSEVNGLKTLVADCVRSHSLSDEDSESLSDLHSKLEGSPYAATWVMREHTNIFHQTLPYFVNLQTNELQWTPPHSNEIIELGVVRGALEQLHQRLGMEISRRDSISSARLSLPGQLRNRSNQLASATFEAMQSINGSDVASHSPANDEPVFERMRAGPGSRFTIARLPYRFFSELAAFSSLTWWLTMLYGVFCFVVLDTDSVKLDMLGATTLDLLDVTAVACDGKHMILGDGLEVQRVLAEFPRPSRWADVLPVSAEVELESLLLAEDLVSSWRSTTVTQCEQVDDCLILLQLDTDGRSVVETIFRAGNGTGWSQVLRRQWVLSPLLESNLIVISARRSRGVHGELCDGSAWALFGASTVEVVALCPAHGVLTPVRAVFDMPVVDKGRLHAVPSAMHVDEDTLYLMRREGTRTQVEVMSRESRVVLDLPSGRRWAPGLCKSHEGAFLTLGSHAGQLEIWQITSSLGVPHG